MATPKRGLSLVVGLHGLNSEFDRLESAGLLLNSSYGIEPAFSDAEIRRSK
jgi:hypothetical protein